MTDSPHTTPMSESERRAHALDRLLDLSQPISRLEDIADRATILAQEMRARVKSAMAHVGALYELLEDGAGEGEDRR
jgi:hypothetical protein